MFALDGIRFTTTKKQEKKTKKPKKEKKRKKQKCRGRFEANNSDNESSGSDGSVHTLSKQILPQTAPFEERLSQAGVTTAIPKTLTFEELLTKARKMDDAAASAPCKQSHLVPLSSGRESFADPNKSAAAALRLQLLNGTAPGNGAPTGGLVGPVTSEPAVHLLEKADLRHGSRRGKRKTNVNRYDQSGCRTSFLGADKFHKEGESTGALGESAEDLDKIYAKNIIRQGKRFKMTKGSSTGADEEEDIDTNLYENKRDWMSALKRREVDRAEVLMADKRWENRVSRDKFNRENSHFANHLVLSSLSSAYLMIPHTKPITPHHCLIVPTEPLKSMSQADVSVSEDVDRYKSALVRMFGNESPSRSVVFMETVVNLEKAHHTCIHAVPLDEELAQDAPLYFKQALQTSGSEWTSHKMVIDTSQKGLAKSVPPSFPYFHVELCSLDYSTCGMAHIIDDSSRFPASYGLDILCGLLGLPPQNFDKQMKVSMGFSDQRQMVMELASKFLKFDPAKTRE